MCVCVCLCVCVCAYSCVYEYCSMHNITVCIYVYIIVSIPITIRLMFIYVGECMYIFIRCDFFLFFCCSLYSKMTMEVILSTAFGRSVDVQGGKGGEIYEDARGLFKVLTGKQAMFMRFIQFILSRSTGQCAVTVMNFGSFTFTQLLALLYN